MERWQGELEILKRLDHLNIVKAQNVPEGLDYLIPMSNTPFICMEYCDGGDLRQVGNIVCVLCLTVCCVVYTLCHCPTCIIWPRTQAWE